jgi:Rieske 2Fe-2S family protein
MAITASRQATVQRRAFTLAGHYYTSGEIFEQETNRIFAKHWLCVGRSEQIPEPGDYFLTQVGTEGLIILRDLAGTARAFLNICRYRGTRLCTQAQGHFAESIQSPCQGWTYSLTGQRQTVRQMQQVEGCVDDYSLYACILHEWEGFLWVNLAANPVPFAQTFAPLLSRFTPWQMTDLRQGHRLEYDVHANWKLIFQNYSECYHRPSVQSRRMRSSSDYGRIDLAASAFWGSYTSCDRLTDAATSLPQPGGNSEDRQRIYYYSLFPTMLLSLHPDFVVVHRLYPQAAGRTQVVCDWLFEPTAIDHPDFDPSHAVEWWDFANRQDWHLCELMQQSMSRGDAPMLKAQGRLANFDREYLRVMGGLSDLLG